MILLLPSSLPRSLSLSLHLCLSLCISVAFNNFHSIRHKGNHRSRWALVGVGLSWVDSLLKLHKPVGSWTSWQGDKMESKERGGGEEEQGREWKAEQLLVSGQCGGYAMTQQLKRPPLLRNSSSSRGRGSYAHCVCMCVTLCVCVCVTVCALKCVKSFMWIMFL